MKGGGQAFPRAAAPSFGYPAVEGMTLRDYFAGQALIGLMTDGTRALDLVAEAYEFADSMIAERDK